MSIEPTELARLKAIEKAARAAWPFLEPTCSDWKGCNKGWHQEEGEALDRLDKALYEPKRNGYCPDCDAAPGTKHDRQCSVWERNLRGSHK